MINKFLVALLGMVAMAVASVLTDGQLTWQEAVQVVVAVVTAVQVWITANVPSLKWAKSLTAGLLAAASLAISYITDNQITASEALNLVIAALVAAGVWAVPNTAGVARPNY